MQRKQEDKREGRSTAERVVRIVVFFVVSLLLVAMTAVNVLLTPAVLTRVAGNLAAEYVDGNVSFGKIDVSIVRRFPKVSVRVDSVLVTYPHDMFARYDSVGVRGFTSESGRGESVDTLLDAGRLEVTVNILRALSGDYHIRNAELHRTRIFAHYYDSVTANWHVLKFLHPKDEEEDKDTPLPPVTINRIKLTDRPLVTFSDPADTLFCLFTIKDLEFKGRLSNRTIGRNRTEFSIDSLFIAGRIPEDTVAMGLERLGIRERRDHFYIEAAATAMLALRSIGRLRIPLEMAANLSFPSPEKILGKGYPRRNPDLTDFSSLMDNLGVSIKELTLKAATLSLTGEGDVVFMGDSTYVRGRVGTEKCSYSALADYFGPNFPILKEVRTDASLDAGLSCEGWLRKGDSALPPMHAEIIVPESMLEWKGIGEKGRLGMEIIADTDDKGVLDARIKSLGVEIPGLDLDIRGSVTDILGKGLRIKADASIDASMAELVRFIPDSLGITASGKLTGKLNTDLRKTDLSVEKIMSSNISGHLYSDGITFRDRPLDIFAFLGKTDISIGPAGRQADTSVTSSGRELCLKARIDSLNASYGDSVFFRGTRIDMAAQQADAKAWLGHLNAVSLAMMDQDSLFVGAKGMANTFSYVPVVSASGSVFPRINFRSRNEALSLRLGGNKVSLSDATIGANAYKRDFSTRNSRRSKILDSLSRVYPGIPRDSLIGKIRRPRARELEFTRNDIDIHLSESMAGLWRDWNLSGTLEIGNGQIVTPYYPLNNEVSSLKGKFDNDKVVLDNMTVISGNSDLSAEGSLSGLRRALLSHGILNLDMNLSSGKIDVDEILAAIKKIPSSSGEVDTTTAGTLVLPANLVANVNLQAQEVDYSSLAINWMQADVKMKERCLQITNTLASSNMGDLYLEGFYSSRTRDDLSVGFDLTFVDVTADKVIELIPAVDSIVPMLKTFKGMLDMEMAVTSRIDTSMSLVMPSVNGVIEIGGKNLSLHENPTVDRLADILKFKNKKKWNVDSLSVHGIVKDNSLEIFPFVCRIDRYTLALDGLQHFDSNFKYHLSVLRSPIPVKFGVTLKGNFDNWKWDLGKSRYRNSAVPSFEKQIEGMRLSLINSIHSVFSTGADGVMRQNIRNSEAVEQQKAAVGYQSDVSTGELSSEEMSALESAGESEEEKE